MLSIGYSLAVRDYSSELIGYHTLVRSHSADLVLELTNDTTRDLGNLTVKIVTESYIGGEKPQLFRQSDPEKVKNIPAKGMVPVEFAVWANFPGVLSVAIYVQDKQDKAVKSKRPTEVAYQELPVRYWFHVVDNIAVDTLVALNKLIKNTVPKAAKK